MTLTKEQVDQLRPGDIVREVVWNGIEPAGLGNVYEVEEVNNTIIMLKNNPCNIALAPCFLELVYSAGKENTGVIIQEELKDSTGDRFKVVASNTNTFTHKVEDICTGNIVAYFPWGDPPFGDESTDREEALKKAIDYCDYLNKSS